jgi:hypothetical protein
MWMYSGLSCLDSRSSKELSAAEINTWIHKVLDLGADLNPVASPARLREGVANTRDSMFGHVSVAYMILSFHCTRNLE